MSRRRIPEISASPVEIPALTVFAPIAAVVVVFVVLPARRGPSTGESDDGSAAAMDGSAGADGDDRE